ncbi:MAG: hypothetical protein ACXV7G_13570, partial [Halobacteriota archaeon]
LVRPVFFIVFTAVTLVVGVLSMKLAAESLSTLSLYSVHTSLLLLVSLLAFVLQGLLWLQVLKHYPLSIAYPAFSIVSFIILVIAALYLNEGITYQNVLGLIVISFGVLVLSRSVEGT